MKKSIKDSRQPLLGDEKISAYHSTLQGLQSESVGKKSSGYSHRLLHPQRKSETTANPQIQFNQGPHNTESKESVGMKKSSSYSHRLLHGERKSEPIANRQMQFNQGLDNTAYKESKIDLTLDKKHNPHTLSTSDVKAFNEVLALNDVSSWDMDDIFTKYKKTYEHQKPSSPDDLTLYGAVNTLHFSEKCSMRDKQVFEQQRNIRRNAIHIYDRVKFKMIFKDFLSMIHVQSYF